MRIEVIAAGAVLGLALAELSRRLGVDPETGEDALAPDLLDYANQLQGAARGYFEEGDEMNKAAFLRAIRLGEGTAGGDGYAILCGGGKLTTYTDHPANLGWGGWRMPAQMAINAGFPGGRAVSTAAGAYQITRPTWNRLAARLGLFDFSPDNQDAAAWELIREKGAAADVRAGRVGTAIAKLGAVWASLPGAAAKQRQVSATQFINEFENAGGILA